VGIVVLWRRGDTLCLHFLAGVFALASVAACLGKYPLGGHPRFVLYLSPLVVLPIAVGMASLIHWRTRDAAVMRSRGVAALTLLVLIGLGGMVKDLAKPYFNKTSRNVGEFARWFWNDYQATAPGPLARVTQDGTVLPTPLREHGYLHARYSPNALTLRSLPRQIEGPTGLVLCTVEGADDPRRVAAWRTALSEQYDLFDHDAFQIELAEADRPAHYEVFWIRPSARDAQALAEPVRQPKEAGAPFIRR
jgi:hypothetical protein